MTRFRSSWPLIAEAVGVALMAVAIMWMTTLLIVGAR
jgi:hypothetical protein